MFTVRVAVSVDHRAVELANTNPYGKADVAISRVPAGDRVVGRPEKATIPTPVERSPELDPSLQYRVVEVAMREPVHRYALAAVTEFPTQPLLYTA